MNEILVYIGTYSRGGKGIYIYRFDSASGELTSTGQTVDAQNPSFVTLHPNGRFLYAVSEGKDGAVSSYAVDAQSGALKFLNRQSSHGVSPCHLAIDSSGRLLAVSNYSSGTVAALLIASDGTLGEATSVHQHQGVSARVKPGPPHAHSTTIDSSNRFAFAADLGLDKIFSYRVDTQSGKLTPNDVPFVALQPGAGPRHFAFHPSNKYAYVINELDSTITVFLYNAQKGALTELQNVPSLPTDFAGKNSGADIHLAPSGKFLYASNRGHDSIAIFSISAKDGRLTPIGHQPARGRTPRNFGLSPDGQFMLVANQESNNVVVFRVDAQTGKLSPTGQSIEVPAPVCVTFLARD